MSAKEKSNAAELIAIAGRRHTYASLFDSAKPLKSSSVKKAKTILGESRSKFDFYKSDDVGMSRLKMRFK